MTADQPTDPTGLKYPWVRTQLIDELKDLANPELLSVWAGQIAQGWVVGVDEVVHFFFDEHPFDAKCIGFYLHDEAEVEAMSWVLAALDRLLDDVPNGTDEDYVRSPVWPEVADAARRALKVMERQ